MKLALSPIVAQLKRAGARSVDGILEFATQAEEPRALPAFFVVPTAELPSGNAQNAGARDQRVQAGVSVMVVLDGARRNAAGVAEDVKHETGRVIEALVGWTHPEAAGPFDYAGGRLVSASGSTVVWEVRLTTHWRLRKAG